MKGAIIFALILLTGTATGAWAEITGSAHDFSGNLWSGGQICAVCHTPHNSDRTVTEAPLWNHALSSATYTVYSSPTMDQTPDQPKGISKLCLSCHDGTVALDSFGNKTGGSYISGTSKLGTDLSDDHPVSITWNHQTIQPFDFGSEQCTYCHDNIGEDPSKFPLPFYSYDGGITYTVECSSCHDPHNKGPQNMLRLEMTGSTLCLECHNR